jgi:hypothetical protein
MDGEAAHLEISNATRQPKISFSLYPFFFSSSTSQRKSPSVSPKETHQKIFQLLLKANPFSPKKKEQKELEIKKRGGD